MEGRHFPTLTLASLVFAACRIDSVGLAPGDDATAASGTGGTDAPVNSASTGAAQTTVASASSGSSRGSAPGTGGHGGDGGAGGEGGAAGGGGAGGVASTSTTTGTGGDGGGGAPPVDECSEGVDGCLAGERCIDLADGFDCSPLEILLLEDEGNGADVVSEGLTTVGAAPVGGPAYAAWDGTNPSLDSIDAVLWLQGVQTLSPMPPGGQTELAAFVAAGGGLVRTEWGGYASATSFGPADIIMPVSFIGTTGTGTVWTRVVADHPIGQGVTSPFPDATASWALVAAEAGATVVWEGPAFLPLVVTTDAFVGRVVYVNYAATSTGLVGPEVTQILIDAAIYAAQ